MHKQIKVIDLFDELSYGEALQWQSYLMQFNNTAIGELELGSFDVCLRLLKWIHEA